MKKGERGEIGFRGVPGDKGLLQFHNSGFETLPAVFFIEIFNLYPIGVRMAWLGADST